MTQNASPEQTDITNSISVVCDHCSSGYKVSMMHFADSFKHEFDCPNCEQSWVEYLDIPIWENLRDAAQEIRRIEQEAEDKQRKIEEDKQRKIEEDKIAREEAEKAAIILAEQEAQALAAQKMAEGERQKQEALEKEILAQEEIDQEKADQEKAEREQTEQEKDGQTKTERDQAEQEKDGQEQADKVALEASTDETNDDKKPKTKDKVETPKADKDTPKKLLIFYANPKNWAQFSLVSISIGICILVTIYIGSASYFYINRMNIVQANPLAAAPYHAVGISVSPVDGLDVELEDLERKELRIPGEQTQYTFSIRSKVRNFSETERRLPYLRIYLQDLEDETIEFWDVNLTGRVLQSDEEMNVVTNIPAKYSGDERVETFIARLISKEEREYLGLGKIFENIAADS